MSLEFSKFFHICFIGEKLGNAEVLRSLRLHESDSAVKIDLQGLGYLAENEFPVIVI